VCCNVLQCVAVCCKCVAVCCSVMQRAAVCCTTLHYVAVCGLWLRNESHGSVLQCIAVCCSALHCAALCCSVLGVSCSVLHYAALHCIMSQYARCSYHMRQVQSLLDCFQQHKAHLVTKQVTFGSHYVAFSMYVSS